MWLQPLDLMTKFRFSHSLETDWTTSRSICLTKQIWKSYVTFDHIYFIKIEKKQRSERYLHTFFGFGVWRNSGMFNSFDGSAELDKHWTGHSDGYEGYTACDWALLCPCCHGSVTWSLPGLCIRSKEAEAWRCSNLPDVVLWIFFRNSLSNSLRNINKTLSTVA